VLIDDLINKGTDEPYRMFTSRAEFRTLMRQDNADIRLTEISYNMGLASEESMQRVNDKKAAVQQIKDILAKTTVEPAEINGFLEEKGISTLKERQKVQKILLRPDITLKELMLGIDTVHENLKGFKSDELEQAEIQVKYDTYIEKEKEMVAKMSAMEDLIIPDTFNYEKLQALSTEARQKLTRIKPHTLGQASRISGVNPSDVQILLVYMGR
jgi:tRNA uridine 5-carboxymethylaminomethyl modification enzyme